MKKQNKSKKKETKIELKDKQIDTDKIIKDAESLMGKSENKNSKVAELKLSEVDVDKIVKDADNLLNTQLKKNEKLEKGK